MNDDEILLISKNQKDTATRILTDSNLLSILSKYGKCSLVGSYKYDLMLGSDIDIVVENEDPRGASVSAIKDLIDRRLFQKYQYGDFEKFPRENRPRSFIVVLISEIDGVRWEVEIWFEKKYPDNIASIDLLMNDKLTPELRLTILKLKQQREGSGDDKNLVSGPDIYRAVLENGVNDYSEIVNR